jgi:hypothetical protein
MKLGEMAGKRQNHRNQKEPVPLQDKSEEILTHNL